MDPQVPSSFIPKKPFSATPVVTPVVEGNGIVYAICLFLFVVSIIAAGGVFAYQAYLGQAITDKGNILAKDQTALDFPAIEDIVRLDSRINQSKGLLAKHVAPSAIFAFLSQETLQNVQFTSFKYELQPNGSALITLDGIADSFSTVALQSDQLSSNKLLKDILFTNLDTKDGQVTFTVQATAQPQLFLYSTTIGTPVSTTPPPTQTATTTPVTPATTTNSTSTTQSL